MILENNGRLTPAAQVVLAAVSRVPRSLIRPVRVLPQGMNWLHFPWHSRRSGGGAFVMGDRIYASTHFFEPARRSGLPFLQLLAHEVGHLPHAARFGSHAVGRGRFVVWAMGHYAVSYARHGKEGHRNARIEQEAERGRWVLRKALERTPNDPISMAMLNGTSATAWIERHATLIAQLHRDYPGWKELS